MEEGDDSDGHYGTDASKTIGSMIGAQGGADFANPVSNRLNQVDRWEMVRVPLIIECRAKFNIRFSVGALLPAQLWADYCFGPEDEANKATCTRKA